MKRKLGFWLRRLADRIDYHGAPRHTGMSFTIEHGVGLVVHEDGRGCHLWYMGEDEYDKAHDEAGREPYRAAPPLHVTPQVRR